MDKTVKKPKVSVILPVYNGAPYLAGAVSSVLDQTFEDFELIVVDDGSTDDSAAIVKSFDDARIILLENSENIGLQKSLNRGIANAAGEYIARIDADDEWLDERKLETQVSYLDATGDCVLVGTSALIVDENGNVREKTMRENDAEIREHILKANEFIHSSVVIRKSALIEAGLYGQFDSVRHVEDYDLWLRLGKLGTFHNLQTKSVLYRETSGSLTSVNALAQFQKNVLLIWQNRRDYPHFYAALLRNVLKVLLYGYGRLLPLKREFDRFLQSWRAKGGARRKRVVVFESLSHVAGGQRVLLNNLPFLKAKFDVSVMVPKAGDFSRALAAHGVRTKYIDFGTYPNGKKTWKDVVKYIFLLFYNAGKLSWVVCKSDAIYVNSTRALPIAWIFALAFHKKIVWHVHSLMSGFMIPLVRFIGNSNRIVAIIAVSNAVAAQYPKLQDKIAVVYNGIDVEKFHPLARRTAHTVKKIVVVGDLMTSKGQDVLIRALAEMKDVSFVVQFVGAPREGGEDFATALETLVNQLGLNKQVEFLGRREDVTDVVRAADVLVMPSVGYESFGMAALEAMASGVPVVASNRGGIVELVESGKTGFLCEAGDAKDLHSKLEQFFALESKAIAKMRKACRKVAEEKFELAKSVAKIVEIIETASSK